MSDSDTVSSKTAVRFQSVKAPSQSALANCGIVKDLRDPQQSAPMQLQGFKNVAIQQPLPTKSLNDESLIAAVNVNETPINPFTAKHAKNDYRELPATNKWMMSSQQLPGNNVGYIPAAWVYWIADAQPKALCAAGLGQVRQPINHLIEPINFIFVVNNTVDESSANEQVIKTLALTGFSSLDSLFHTGGYASYFDCASNVIEQLSLPLEKFIQLLAPRVADFCRVFSLEFVDICNALELEIADHEPLMAVKLSDFCNRFNLTLSALCQQLSLYQDFAEIPLTFANQDYTKGGDHFRLLGPYKFAERSYIYTASVSAESPFVNQSCHCGHLYVSFTEAKYRLATKLADLKTTVASPRLYTTNLFNTVAMLTAGDFDAREIFFTGDHQIEKNNPLAEISFVAVLN
jgi:hypothetical protein